MLNIILWAVIGIIIVFIGCYLLKVGIDKNNVTVGFLIVLTGIALMIVGAIVTFIPEIQKSQENEDLDIKTCQHIGGNYEVIDKVWNGKSYTYIYGCVK